MARMQYVCNECARKCQISIGATESDHMDRYLVCPDVTMHLPRIQIETIKYNKSRWLRS
jgi:DNA-directed RNA polymerase subunit RPC12/RpoP